MKSFTVTAFFPEAKAHLAYQSITINAGDLNVAVARGISRLRSRPGIAGKHITEVRLTIKLVGEELDCNSGGKV
jgi:hypothetical protein